MSGRSAIFAALMLNVTMLSVPAHGQALRPFTVAEEIGLARLNRYDGASPVKVSPNGRYVAVCAERGILDEDLMEGELRVYAIAALTRYVVHPGGAQAPRPIVDLRESTYKEGPIIRDIRWLPDSKGLAFLLKSARGNNQLAYMALTGASPKVLSLKHQDVTAFGVRDARHYAYSVLTPGSGVGGAAKRGSGARDDTGHGLYSLLFPKEMLARVAWAANTGRSVLWAMTGGVPHEVKLRNSGKPIVLYPHSTSLALSPDGDTLAVELPVPEVPASWVRKFPPWRTLWGIRAGRQNLNATFAHFLTGEYGLIDLRNGDFTPVNGAPTGYANGWWGFAAPAWSQDGKALLLPNAYPRPTGGQQSIRAPCAAIFYPATHMMRCLAPLRHRVYIGAMRFAGYGSDKVIMRIVFGGSGLPFHRTKVLTRTAGGAWRVATGTEASRSRGKGLRVYVKQGLNEPPILVAYDRRINASRVIWNPNPQLKHIALGAATVYHWKDATGRAWTGGLYKPPNYIQGRRYPLVIQTHGFDADQFHPSGLFPAAFAARALAATGIMVLQSQECPSFGSPKEGPCDVAGDIAAVKQLSASGLVDPNRIGIIGFSHSVYQVMEGLTTGTLRFAAASVTDGIDVGYMQYLEAVDMDEDLVSDYYNAEIGAKPFGAGLRLWLKRSPEFNMQRVHTPLLVVGEGRASLLSMWGPYAELRYLGKPVDLVMLNTIEHVLSEPAMRMASQGSSVDWFRFWLQGYESPHPVMAGEYRPWEKLCDMQIEQNPGHPTWCVPTQGFRIPRSTAGRTAGD